MAELQPLKAFGFKITPVEDKASIGYVIRVRWWFYPVLLCRRVFRRVFN